VLQYHPDKNINVDDTIFKKITAANDVLGDPKKRRVYDSQDEFDDSIPTGNEGNFYQIFGDAFERFGRWSSVRPLPKLGDDNTSFDQVKKFYDFWFSFKSWRDFSADDEFDFNEAESREEKRWMERQNERERRKKKKEESAKVFKLADTAEKLDPRLKKRRDQLMEEKRKQKEVKQEAARKRKEEEEQKEAEEKAKKEEEEKKKAEEVAQKQKQKALDNKKLRKLRTKLRTLCGSLSWNPSPESVEIICNKLSLSKMTALVKSLESDPPDVSKKLFDEELRVKEEKEIKGESSSGKPWTEDELSLLAKAVSKYPGGVHERWQLIADFIGTRSVKEIIAKTKEAKYIPNKVTNLGVVPDAFERFAKIKKATPQEINSPLSMRDEGEFPAEKTAIPSDWTGDEQKLLEKALTTFPSTLKDRWDKIAESIPGRTKKECIERYKYLVQQIKEKKAAQEKK